MSYSYQLRDGVFRPGLELSKLERDLFLDFENMLILKGFQVINVPESVRTESFCRQEVVSNEMAYWLDGSHMLNGSAEQGILDYFSDTEIGPLRLYSFTHCFRREQSLRGLVRLKEFKKLEQFIFCNESEWQSEFDLVLYNATDFLSRYNIEHRVVDVTKRDPGYHIKKLDIEINTKQYGWIESHSCSYFGNEQTQRLGITGSTHSISNTGIASPRILIPFIEKVE